MKIAGWVKRGPIAGCLIMFLAAPFARAAAAPWQNAVPAAPPADSASAQQSSSASGTKTQNTETAQADAALPDAPDAAPMQSDNAGGQNGNQQPPAQEQPQNSPQKPVGTAAAPSEVSTGVAASKPAGAVIAPAKQRRVRTILISVGVVIAACVAVGTVAGLSRTSPSQPK